MSVNPYITFTKKPLPYAPCRKEQFSHLTNVTKFDSRNMTDFLCTDVSDLRFQGTFQDDTHLYLHFEILACEEALL